MNVTNTIDRRERGFGMVCDYDIALYRLKCYYNDVYHGITPNTNVADYNPEPPVFACRFCTTPGYEEILALANEDGKVAFQDTRIKDKYNLPLEGTQAHCNAIFDIAWMPGEMKLVTASGDHSARLWDVTRPEIKQINYFHAHTRSVKTAVFRDDDKAVFATGARDGFIMIWDIRANHSDQPKPDNCIANAHSIGGTGNTRRKSHTQTSRAQSITGLVFQDDFTLISCAAGDGLLKVWDLRKNYTVHKKEPIAKHLMNYSGNSTRNGFSSLLICPNRITLYASCMDNIIYAYNVSSYNHKPVAEYYGHQNRTYYVKTCLSSDGRYLASGSSDELAYIWNTNRPVTTPESSKEDYNENKHNSVKRSYLQMMIGSRSEEKFKCILSPIYENHETVAKRPHMDNRGMRRLFGSSNETPTTTRDYNSDEPSTSQSTSRNEQVFLSPTINLPNFVVDGTAPHLLEISPQKYKENVDWLTKYRKEKYEQKKTASTSSSPKTQSTPGRRSNRSRSTEPQKVTKTIKSSILNFFNKEAIIKENEKDLPSNNNTLPPTSTS
ncbi:Protein lethal(2)denticleless [Temnothorax longispinosus]|uniref:Protein lethal(2)denticleless n=1 Tax=Temnothorax longispinosus TaxID=300112 RepID=A0A4S2KWX3_9HYME|nr:Protein lethal(2)denticleless [Temnothorax longispinosus]